MNNFAWSPQGVEMSPFILGKICITLSGTVIEIPCTIRFIGCFSSIKGKLHEMKKQVNFNGINYGLLISPTFSPVFCNVISRMEKETLGCKNPSVVPKNKHNYTLMCLTFISCHGHLKLVLLDMLSGQKLRLSEPKADKSWEAEADLC